jgi:1-acyl-sn-glycerol-3-phosphate acyltransferase
VKWGFRIFMRRIQVAGLDRVPHDRPVILVANHQNAMMDPVLCCCFFPPQLHWLTRADVFKNPTVKNLLTNFNMLPVYRERDRVGDMQARNQEIFEIIYQRLQHNAIICLFPEGTHRGKKQLMPLKKGVVRMATGAIEAGVQNAIVLPVGIDYEDYYHYRKDVLIVVGEPIPLALYEASLQSDSARTQNVLLQDIRSAMRKVMVDIDHDHEYDVLIGLRPLINEIAGGDLPHQFNFYHTLLEQLAAQSPSAAAIQTKGKQYLELLHAIAGDDALHPESQQHQTLPVLLALPVAAIGALFFLPLYALIERIQKKLVKDPLFINSIRIVGWTFLTPLYLLIAAGLLSIGPLAWWQSILAVAGLALAGRLSLWWNHRFRALRYAWHLSKVKRIQPETFGRYAAARKDIIDLVQGIAEQFPLIKTKGH